MGRDMRDSYRPRRGGDPQDDRETPRRQSRDRPGDDGGQERSTPSPRGSTPSPRSGSGNLRPGGSIIKQPFKTPRPDDGSGEYDREPSRAPGYTDYRPSRPGDRSNGYDTERGDQPTNGNGRTGRRSMADMARDMSRSVSRQLSSVMSRVGRSVDPGAQIGERARAVPPAYANLSEEETLNLAAQAYRRSRIRLVARKWRLKRVRANPITYFIGIMTVIVVLVTVGAGGGAGSVYAISYYQRHVTDIQGLASLRDQANSGIYDRNGKQIYVAQASNGYHLYVPVAQMSLKLQAATIDTEDHTYYSNSGVDIYGTLRAALADLHAGGAAQGGSTITQQLVKNIVIDDTSQTLQRKLNEAILAYGITQQYTKAFILEMYLNTIPYGQNNTGIEAAARNYFGLQPETVNGQQVFGNEQLSWAQAAILAALPNAPTLYQPDVYSCSKAPCPPSQWSNPYQGNPQYCGAFIPSFGPDWYAFGQNGHEWLVFCRAKLVLANVLQYGVPGHADMDLTQTTYEQAVNQVYNILINQQVYDAAATDTTNGLSAVNLAPHFVSYVSNELANDFGITDLSTAGLKIYTTLDDNLQQYAQKDLQHYIQHNYHEPWYPNNGVKNYWDPLQSADNGNAHNGAMVAIDQRTGDILAMVGSVDYSSTNTHILGANNLTILPRSMGSATKPLMYATAFQMGWTPGTMLQDEPICFPDPLRDPNTGQPTPNPISAACKGWYLPQDDEENNFSGTFPLRYQFDGSLNIAATEGMEFVGATPSTSANFIDMAGRLGVTTAPTPNLCPPPNHDCVTTSAMGPTTTLGTQDISLLQLTSAYGTLANLGQRAVPRSILEITKADGTVLWQAPKQPQTQQVISPQAAFMVTSVLTDNTARTPFFKPLNPLTLGDDTKYQNMAIAGKTGTSSGTGGPNDIVTAGYTPYMSVGVWVGNTDGHDPLNPSIIGVAGAGYIFHDVMDWAANTYKWDPTAQFPVPPDMARGSFNCTTGLAPYQGSSASDLNCPWNPVPQLKNSATYDPYLGTTSKPDSDWYIVGDEYKTS